MSIEKNTPNILRQLGRSFTTIINSSMDSIKDPASLGIYCYLSSKPDGWEIREKELQSRFGKGREFISDRLKDLTALGFINKICHRDSSGKITHWETILKNHITGNPSSGVDFTTIRENQNQVKPESGFHPPLSNNRVLVIKESASNKPLSDSKKSPDEYRDNNLFMQFYQNYPRKEKPKEAYKAFLKLNATDEFVNMMLNDLVNRQANNWLGRDRSKIPHPSTYLNQHEWEGEIFKTHNTTGGKAKGYSMAELRGETV